MPKIQEFRLKRTGLKRQRALAKKYPNRRYVLIPAAGTGGYCLYSYPR